MPLTEAQFDLLTFEFEEMLIYNPFLSECGRFEESPSYYGFEVADMGGNCKAWVKSAVNEKDEVRYIVITDLGGCNLPEPGSDPSEIRVGVKGADFGEDIVSSNLGQIVDYYFENY